MIREVTSNKIVDKLDEIIQIITGYVGEEYKKDIVEAGDKIKVSLIKGKGVVKVDDGQIYVSDEPVCIKEKDKTNIVLPLNMLGEKSGNVIFVHLVLHAIFNDTLKNYSAELNEVLIDYMANDIAKILRHRKINVTLNKEPVYDSMSFYAQLFEEIRCFYANNKSKLYEAMLRKSDLDIEGIEEVANRVENKINDLIFNEQEPVSKNAKR